VYSAGLIQPSDPLPTASLAALILEMKPATAGHEAEVPDTSYLFPPIITS
jgi:hypothetical protein